MSQLSTSQTKAIAALLTGATQGEAAAAAGVERRTVVRWLTDDAFCNELRTGQRHLMDHAVRKLIALADDITEVQHTIMMDTSEPAQVRLRASQLLRDGLYRGAELRELTDATEILESINHAD